MLKRVPQSRGGAGTKRGRGEVSKKVQPKSKKLVAPEGVLSEVKSGVKIKEEEEEEEGEEEIAEEAIVTSASSSSSKDAASAETTASTSLQPHSFPRIVSYVNKQRVLVFGSRGLTARYRHLMEDIRSLLPHHKKEAKLDAKHDMLSVVNDIAQIKGCGATIFFEVRKRRDLFLWLSKTPSGPSVKFHVVNVHTMDELRLTGNCLRGSRPILSFDAAFDDEKAAPHLRLIRELLTLAFATPLGHPKSQPFHDHVMAFGWADNRIWYRHYQVVDRAADAVAAAKMLSQGEQPSVLVEIGPRFVLDIIKIFSKSLGGATLYSNPRYISPNLLRHELYKQQGSKYMARKAQESEREVRQEDLVIPANPLDDVYKK